MVALQFCSLPISVRGVSGFSSATMAAPAIYRFPRANLAPFGSSFLTGRSPLLTRSTSQLMRPVSRTSMSIRCEKGGSGLDVWLGRAAMVGFGVAISTEVATGKGLLGNFGLSAPLPTLALAATGLVGIVAAILIFQSASSNDYT